MPVLARRRVRSPPIPEGASDPFKVWEWFFGFQETVPDIMEFCISDRYLNRPNLYPRQATVLKIMFLQDELFTQYDHDVIGEWIQSFQDSSDEQGIGNNGTQPDIYERIAICKAEERPWFREVLAVCGRRGSKGHIGGIAGSYILWSYLAKGDPQGYYGVDRDKRLGALVFAGKKEQAKANQWKDLTNIILGAPCLAGETQVVTFDGVKEIGSCAGTTQRLMTVGGKWVDAPIRSFGTQSLMKIVLRRNSVTKTIFATPEHRWFVVYGNRSAVGSRTAERRTDQLRPGHKLAFTLPRSMATRGVEPSPFGIAQGFVFGDGSDKGRGSYGQFFPPKDLPMVEYFPKASLSWRGKQGGSGARWSTPSHYPYFFKELPDRDEASNYLYGWLAGYFAADGCVSKEGQVTIASASRKNLEFVQNLATQLGIGTYSIRLQKKNGGSKGNNADPSYVLGFMGTTLSSEFFCLSHHRENFVVAQNRERIDHPGWKVESVEVTDRVEEVFCAEVPETHAFVLEGFILTGNCFSPYISNSLGQSLTVYAPQDFARMLERRGRGIVSEDDMATFEIIPKESTTMAGRGPASFLQMFDEMAHVVNSGANRSAEEVWDSSTPSLDQFGKDAFIYEPSSPWQKLGQFYTNYQRSLELEEDGSPVYPEMFMFQLTSWDIYKDWEKANDLKVWPDGIRFTPLRGPIQALDDQMRRLERANPATFAVERRSHFAASLNAYLSEARIADIWKPWPGDRNNIQQDAGLLSTLYRAHGDPSQSGANFGWGIAHVEYPPLDIDDRGLPHVVFDKLHAWIPGDFEGHEIDYDIVRGDIMNDIDAFIPDIVSFDQWNSIATVQALRKHVANKAYPKSVMIEERTATGPLNWRTYETFKTALGLGLVHGPFFELADLELTFLQDLGNKVDHPTSGPVQTKDVSDVMAIVVMELIGDAMAAFVGKTLSDLSMVASLQGGVSSPFPGRPSEGAHDALSGFGRARGMRPGMAPASARRTWNR